TQANGLETAFGPNDKYAIRYYIDDHLGLDGPFATVGGSYRVRIGERFALRGRAEAGMLFARSIDGLSASARVVGGAPVPFGIVGGGSPVHSLAVLVAPEVGASMTFGAFEVGAGFGMFLL